MGSTERDMLARIKANCEAIDGSGSYNYDFSATDAVILGTEPVGTAPRAPGIYIFPIRVASSRDRGRVPMNKYHREMVVQLDVWVPRTAGTAENAMLAALDAQSDVMRVLENDPTVNGKAIDIEVDASSYDSEAIQIPGYGVATLQLIIEYHEKRGN